MVKLIREDGKVISRTLAMITTGRELQLHTYQLLKGGNKELWICSPFISDVLLGPGTTLSYFINKMLRMKRKVILITQDLEQHKDFLDELYFKGVDVFILKGVHAKILFFLRGNRPVIISGSANVTHGGYKRNYEASMITDIEDLTHNTQDFLMFLKRISIPYGKIIGKN